MAANLARMGSRAGPLLQSLSQVTDFNQPPFSFSLTAQEAEILVSAEVYSIARKGIDPRLIEAYNRALAKARRDAFLDVEFDIDSFEAFIIRAEKEGYFSPKRRLKLGKRVVDAAEAHAIIEEKKMTIFSDPDVAAARNKILSAFSKKASGEVRKLLNEHPELLPLLSNPKDLMTRVIATAFSPDLPLLISYQTTANDHYGKLQSILDPDKCSFAEYQDVWEDFRGRFGVTAYEIEIGEEKETLTGLSFPVLYKAYSRTKVPIPDNNRLSDGEKKTFYLINLVLQIELLLKTEDEKQFHIILDDAVDSFDYRNKFAFLQYFSDLLFRVETGQVFILTHSFDFYRSLIYALRSARTNSDDPFNEIVGRFRLTKKRDGSLSVFDATSLDGYVSLRKLGKWKLSGERAKFFASIALARGVAELRNESEDPFIPYLHFMGDETSFEEVNHLLFTDNNSPYDDHDIFLKELFSLCDSFVTAAPGETELEKKVCLALAIRLLRERFLLAKGRDMDVVLPERWRNNSRMRIVNEMEGHVLRSVGDTTIRRTIINAKVISNQNVHLNDFSFEPIIDIGVDLLLESYEKLTNLNLEWESGSVTHACVNPFPTS